MVGNPRGKGNKREENSKAKNPFSWGLISILYKSCRPSTSVGFGELWRTFPPSDSVVERKPAKELKGRICGYAQHYNPRPRDSASLAVKYGELGILKSRPLICNFLLLVSGVQCMAQESRTKAIECNVVPSGRCRMGLGDGSKLKKALDGNSREECQEGKILGFCSCIWHLHYGEDPTIVIRPIGVMFIPRI